MRTLLSVLIFYGLFIMVYRVIVHFRFYICGLKFKYNGTQSVITAAYGNARSFYPVTVIKNIISGAMGKGKDILIKCFPGFIALSFGLGIVGIKYLAFFKHRTGA